MISVAEASIRGILDKFNIEKNNDFFNAPTFKSALTDANVKVIIKRMGYLLSKEEDLAGRQYLFFMDLESTNPDYIVNGFSIDFDNTGEVKFLKSLHNSLIKASKDKSRQGKVKEVLERYVKKEFI